MFFSPTPWIVVANRFSSHVLTLITSKRESLQAMAAVKRPVWDGHNVEWDVFKRTKDDEKLPLSVGDLTFLHIMKGGFYKDERNSWSPFHLNLRSDAYQTTRHRI